MKTKQNLWIIGVIITALVFGVTLFLCIWASGAFDAFAYADGEEIVTEQDAETIETAEEAKTEEPQNNVIIVSTDTNKGNNLSDVFKNNILPYVTSAGSAILAVALALLPYFKLRGKNKTLQGMYSVMQKTIDAYKEKEGKIEEFITALQSENTEDLKAYFGKVVEEKLKGVVVDNSEEINAVKVSQDIISSQMTAFVNAAKVAWKNSPEAMEWLTKSPSAEVLKDYYNKYLELKALYDEKQGAEVAELNEKIEELGAYDGKNDEANE